MRLCAWADLSLVPASTSKFVSGKPICVNRATRKQTKEEKGVRTEVGCSVVDDLLVG